MTTTQSTFLPSDRFNTGPVNRVARSPVTFDMGAYGKEMFCTSTKTSNNQMKSNTNTTSPQDEQTILKSLTKRERRGKKRGGRKNRAKDIAARNDSPTRVNTELFKTQLCFYHMHGECRWGASCHHAHSEQETSHEKNRGYT